MRWCTYKQRPQLITAQSHSEPPRPKLHCTPCVLGRNWLGAKTCGGEIEFYVKFWHVWKDRYRMCWGTRSLRQESKRKLAMRNFCNQYNVTFWRQETSIHKPAWIYKKPKHMWPFLGKVSLYRMFWKLIYWDPVTESRLSFLIASVLKYILLQSWSLRYYLHAVSGAAMLMPVAVKGN
jgi:hypothetical protein